MSARRKQTGQQILLWIVFSTVYLLYSGTTEIAELVAAAVAGLAAATLTWGLGRSFGRTLLIRPEWLILLLRIPWAMVKETWLLMAALFGRIAGRNVHGRFFEMQIRTDPNAHHAAARRAYMTFGVCITPNSYLIRHDPHTGKVIIRQLAGSELSELDRVFVEI